MLDLSKRLLILACSQRKRSDPGPLPALDRYDGPTYRVLRKFLRERPSDAQLLDVFVLSAKFGLIAASQAIPNYDYRMHSQRARELQPEVLTELNRILQKQEYTELNRILQKQEYTEFHLSLGKDYLDALTGYEQFVASNPNLVVTVSAGSQGRKLSILRDWLYCGSEHRSKHLSPLKPSGKARLRGVEIALNPDQVIQIARQALAEGRGNPDSYQSWYVNVDGRRVAPKWLVSVMTDLPVSSFVTDEARRTLGQLGIAVLYADR